MEFHLTIHHTGLPDMTALLTQGNKIMSALEALAAQVASNTTVIDSAIALIGGLKTKLDEAIASGDPAQIQALSDSLATEDAKLAAAVTANTIFTPAPAEAQAAPVVAAEPAAEPAADAPAAATDAPAAVVDTAAPAADAAAPAA